MFLLRRYKLCVTLVSDKNFPFPTNYSLWTSYMHLGVFVCGFHQFHKLFGSLGSCKTITGNDGNDYDDGSAMMAWWNVSSSHIYFESFRSHSSQGEDE